MNPLPGSNIKNRLHYVLLAVVLGLALYMRLSNLSNVQRFFGDQAAFYNTIMNWKQDGFWRYWPLLGPYRSLGGDHSLGPGWYYLIAPALWLSHFSLAAGAATVGVVGVVGVFLAWLWVRRVTGQAAAALATAAVLGFSSVWVFNDRMIYNPSVMPCTVVALACLLEGLERRPVPCLSLTLMLLAILPQLHTIGIPIALAFLPPAAWGLWRARGRFREASRRSWIGWGLALAAVLTALYLPPLIHEATSKQSNLRHYIKNTFLPAPPQTLPLTTRVARGTDRMIRMTAEYNFNIKGRAARPLLLWSAAAVAALAFAAVFIRRLLRDWRTFPVSLLFLCFILGGHWLLAVLNGANVLDYFLWPALGVPVLLLGWTAGELLRPPAGDGSRRPAGRPIAMLAGVGLLAFGLTLSARQLPQAWRMHVGRYSVMGNTLRDSSRIARHIAAEAQAQGQGQTVSMLFTDAPGSSPLYLHVILRAFGVRTLNSRVNLSRPTPRAFLGQTLYLVARGALDKAPRIQSPVPIELGQPARVADAWIYRIPVASLPAQLKSVRVYSKAPQWFIEVNMP